MTEVDKAYQAMHTAAMQNFDAEIMDNAARLLVLGSPLTAEQARIIEIAVKLVGTFRDANDTGEAMGQLFLAVDALKYEGDYKAID